MQHRNHLLRLAAILTICFILFSPVYSFFSASAQTVNHGGDIPLDLKDASDYTNIVYIDPAAAPGGDGSLGSPLQSWAEVSIQANTAYLQKRGTQANITSAIVVGGDNVLLGAYGPESDPRPIIYDNSDSIKYMIQVGGDGATVRDLEIISPRATSGIHFAAGYWPANGIAWNCSIHGVDSSHYMMWGVRVFGENTKVLHNEIYYIGDDGIFVQYFPNVEIGYNHITHVNQKWFENSAESYSSGDGIQFDSSNGFYIHHNYVDRSDTGNKFCFIVDPKNDVSEGLIENNTCLVAKGISGLFNGGAADYRVVVRNNFFEYVDTDNGGVAIYSHAPHVEIYNNVIKGFMRGVTLISPEGDAIIDHNTFTDIVYNGVWGNIGTLTANNNIFDLDTGADALSAAYDTASHNLFSNADQAEGSQPRVGDPLFVAPSGNDYRLMTNSPAIDTGLAGTGITEDADGNLRDSQPDIGAYEFQPALKLNGSPTDGGINLTWTVNATIPVTSTWRISYQPTAGGSTVVATDVLNGAARSYSLTGLTNGTWYTVTLEAMLNATPFLTDTITTLATDQQIYLPVVIR